MLKDWNEIQERYDAIKNHKPRASKKINELGEILSSAYAQDPEKADEMWQYIVDLNIADDVSYSKFYIASVFNNLYKRMKPEDAVTFLSMNPERVRMMLVYGYDRMPWYFLENLLRGYVAAGDVSNAVTCIGYYYDQFGGVGSGSKDLLDVTKRAMREFKAFLNENRQVEVIDEILAELGKLGDPAISCYVEAYRAANGYESQYDYRTLLNMATEVRLPVEFFDLLWVARDECDQGELRERWIEYIRDCDGSSDIGPWNYIRDDETDYDKSKIKYYVDLEKEADELLEYYFHRSFIYDVEKGVVWSWIENGDWDRFTKYLAQVVMCTPEANFQYSDIKRLLDSHVYGDYSYDHYGRSYRELIQDCKEDFAAALSRMAVMTVGCEAYKDFYALVKAYVQKLSGNIEAMRSAGFDEEEETRSAEERLKEYAHEFLASGKGVHYQSTEYALIQKAFRDEMYGSETTRNFDGKVHVKIEITERFLETHDIKDLKLSSDNAGKDDNKEERELERNYRMALDDEIAEFYFQHFPHAYKERKDLISACVRKGDIDRAIDLIDMMAETKGNEGYEELNGWGRQNMLTMMYLIDEYTTDQEYSWMAKKDITDEMRATVKELVYRMMPNLSKSAADELKKKSLHKINPQFEGADEYISKLLEDAEVYITFPKPRGKGGAPNINRMSEEFIKCFARLSKMGRLDVVVEIMNKFASVKDILKPVTFTSWMSFMARNLKSGDMIQIYLQNKELFEAWLDDNKLTDRDVLRVAEGVANGCSREAYADFCDFVVSRKGNITGLDECYRDI